MCLSVIFFPDFNRRQVQSQFFQAECCIYFRAPITPLVSPRVPRCRGCGGEWYSYRGQTACAVGLGVWLIDLLGIPRF